MRSPHLPCIRPGRPHCPRVRIRLQAETELLQQEYKRSMTALLRPPTAEDLEWVASASGPLCFLWHYADGSTSARPTALNGTSRFDPNNPACVVGCSCFRNQTVRFRNQTVLIPESDRADSGIRPC